MTIFTWIEKAASNTVTFVKEKVTEFTDPIYKPVDELNRKLSSSTVFITNNLSEPLYAQVVANGDWTYVDAVFEIGRVAVGDTSGVKGIAIAVMKLAGGGMKGIGAIDDMQKRDAFMRAQSSLSEADKKAFVTELRESIKKESVRVEPGETKLVHERTTISFNRLTPSAVLAQAFSGVSNHRLIVLSESLAKAAMVNTNENTSWIVDATEIAEADRKIRHMRASSGTSKKLWSVLAAA